MCKVKNGGIFITYWTYSTILQKFQHNQIWTSNFQLKPFVIAVTLKYGQGHWKWYEQVKVNE